MQERVRALGGSFTIESAPAGGTRIRIEIPVKPADMPL
jgi:signal transduction histidine kinase